MAGDTDSTASDSVWIITRFECYNLNDRGRMIVGSPGSALRAERRATPLVRGGASNHGSGRKNVVNSYNDACTRQYTKPSLLVQIMACRLFGSEIPS